MFPFSSGLRVVNILPHVSLQCWSEGREDFATHMFPFSSGLRVVNILPHVSLQYWSEGREDFATCFPSVVV